MWQKLLRFEGHFSPPSLLFYALYSATWYCLYRVHTVSSVLPQSRWPLQTKLAHIQMLADAGDFNDYDEDRDDDDDDEQERSGHGSTDSGRSRSRSRGRNRNRNEKEKEKEKKKQGTGRAAGGTVGTRQVRICPRSLVRLPLRARYSRDDGHAVARFDHHCPFIASTVGAANHHWYVGFLVFSISAMLLLEGVALAYFHAKNGDGYWNRQSWLERFVWNVFAYDGWLACCCCLAFAHILWISILLFYHVRLILSGATTVEKIEASRGPLNRGAYVRYSAGACQNAVDFFGLDLGWVGVHCRRVDWATCYAWPPRPLSRKVMV